MEFFRKFRISRCNDHLLNFLKLMNAVKTLGVLAVGAGLAPETRTPRHDTARKVCFEQNFATVITGQTNFGRANQSAFVLFNVVGLVAPRRKVAGADHGFFFDKDGNCHRRVAALAQFIESKTQDGLLKARAVAF